MQKQRNYGDVHFNYGDEQQYQTLQQMGLTKIEAFDRVIEAKKQMLTAHRIRASKGNEMSEKLVEQMEWELGDHA